MSLLPALVHVRGAERLSVLAGLVREESRERRSGRDLRVLEIDEIKSVPYVPVFHPFVERLIGTIRREYLDRTKQHREWLLWSAWRYDRNWPALRHSRC